MERDTIRVYEGIRARQIFRDALKFRVSSYHVTRLKLKNEARLSFSYSGYAKVKTDRISYFPSVTSSDDSLRFYIPDETVKVFMSAAFFSFLDAYFF